jgi:hypothetical protein
MIKKLLLFVCLFLVSCNTSEDNNSKNEKKIRSIKTTTFNVEEKFGEPVFIFDYSQTDIFDKNGNLTEMSYYDSLGVSTSRFNQVHKEKYSYNENNKPIRHSTFDINGDYVSSWGSYVTTTMNYDSLGNKVTMTGYDKWENIDFIMKTRTDINNVEETIWYDKDNNIKYEYYKKYDSNGNMIEETEYGSNKKRSNKKVQKYIYNSDNKPTKITTDCNYDCSEFEYWGKSWNLYYNEEGNLIEETFEYPENEKYEKFTVKKIHKYDDKNRIIEVLKFDKNNEPTMSLYSPSKEVSKYLDDNNYEILQYTTPEDFGEKKYELWRKKVIEEEFYD